MFPCFLPQAGNAGSWELQVEGSAASHSWDVSGRCEKPDSFCLLKLLVHPFMGLTSFRGYLYPTTWEGFSSRWETAKNVQKPNVVLSRALHLERMDRNHICNSPTPLEQLWVLQAHLHPKSNPGTLAGLTPAVLCRDTAACCS